MGYIPPPPALSKEEFDKRVAAGAKTLSEIDPELHKWNQSMILQHKIQWIGLIIGIIFLFCFMAFVMIK